MMSTALGHGTSCPGVRRACRQTGDYSVPACLWQAGLGGARSSRTRNWPRRGRLSVMQFNVKPDELIRAATDCNNTNMQIQGHIHQMQQLSINPEAVYTGWTAVQLHL